jgi:hypothetical protein
MGWSKNSLGWIELDLMMRSSIFSDIAPIWLWNVSTWHLCDVIFFTTISTDALQALRASFEAHAIVWIPHSCATKHFFSSTLPATAPSFLCRQILRSWFHGSISLASYSPCAIWWWVRAFTNSSSRCISQYNRFLHLSYSCCAISREDTISDTATGGGTDGSQSMRF